MVIVIKYPIAALEEWDHTVSAFGRLVGESGRTHIAGHILVKTNSGMLCSDSMGPDGPRACVSPSAISSDMYVVTPKNASAIP